MNIERPSCFMISESWLSPRIIDSLINLAGYSVYRGDRLDRRGGGVCVYLRDSVFGSCSVSVSDLEVPRVEGICLDLKHECFSLALCCVYRPPDTHSEDDDILFETLASLASHHKTLILCGDFNLPDLSWPTPVPRCYASRLLVDLLDHTHLQQMVSEPTRFRTGQQPSLLDLIITSDTDLVANLEHLGPIGKSDHTVLRFQLQISLTSRPRRTFTNKTVIDFEALKNDLGQVDWVSVLSKHSVEENWCLFCEKLRELQSLNSVSRRYIIFPSKPWINQSVINLIRRKKSLWQRYRRSGLIGDYAKHRHLSNELALLIKDSRRNFETNVVNTSNPRRLYKYVRSSMSSKVTTPQLRNKNGILTSLNDEVASIFADSFAESFGIEPDGMLPTSHRRSRVRDDLSEINFSEEIVLSKLMKLDITKSQGPDGISAALLKTCSSSLCTPVCLLMRQSFVTTALPDMWRMATIRPIYKKGDKFDAKNYRPISLVSIIVKTMESVIVDVMTAFLTDHHVIPSEQHGFTRGRSVVTNLITCVNDWTHSVDSGSCVDVIYLDFSKAFDRVPKQRLLSKLEHAGIRGKLLRWISAFLTNRKFMVRVGDGVSDQRLVLSGVPQGSVLGPLLFNIFTSDLQYFINSKFSLYADDVKLYNDPLDSSHLQADLDSIFSWSQRWLLPLNIEKCVTLHIGRNNPAQTYFIDGIPLKHVSSHSDLGVVINSELTWSEQTLQQVKKANSFGYMMSKAFGSFNPAMTATLFKTYIRPILEFANPVWSPALVRDISMMENVQRRFSRLPYGLQRPSYEERLEIMHLSPLVSRRLRGDLIFTFKALRDAHSPVRHLFVLNPDDRLRGHSLKLSREAFRTSCRQNFIPNRVFYAWNALPGEAVIAPSVNSFKNFIDSNSAV